MSEFRLPALGADMEAGTLIEWKVKAGDAVKKGDIMAVVETDKGAIEVEIFSDATIEALLVKTGERVPVGTPLARLREQGKPVPPPQQPVKEATLPKESAQQRVVPAAKKRAAELGVDLAAMKGTGEGGAVTRADVEAAARQRGVPHDKQAAMRRAIASAMTRANREIPHYYLSDTIDVTAPLAWLAERNGQKPLAERMLPAVLFFKAIAMAAKAHPDFNGFWIDEGAKPSARVHLGVAISLREGGLVTPAIHDADGKSLDELMADLRQLITRVRAGTMRSSEIADATITVTNLGDLGVEDVFGIIYPPQVALVGIGAILERPWVVAGKVEARKLVRFSLAADHRASDGMRGARFLATLKNRLDNIGEAPWAGQ